jgi:hypothetical protein
VLRALQLHADGGVDFPDCLVVALAQAHGCEAVASGLIAAMRDRTAVAVAVAVAST